MLGMNRNFLIAFGLVAIATLSSCGGGSNAPQQELSISPASLPDGTVGTGYSQTIQIVHGTAPIQWMVSDGALPDHLGLSASSGDSVTISGTPDAHQTAVRFTIHVVDSKLRSASQSYSMNIANPAGPNITGSVTPPNGRVADPYSFMFAASGGLPPLSWSSTGGAPPGLVLSKDGTLAGTPTSDGAFQIAVEVTDSLGQSNSATIPMVVVTADASNGKLQGQYAFLFQGAKGGNSYVAAGTFVADGNGNIANGVIDANGVAASELTNVPFSGSYSFDSINQGKLEFKNSNEGLDTTFRFVIQGVEGQPAEAGMIIGFDNITRGSGNFALQDTTAFLQTRIKDDYAFGISGTNTTGGRGAAAGRFTADGSSSVSKGTMDLNEFGTLLSSTAFTGTYSISSGSTTGRGTMTLNTTSSGDPASFHLVFYVVSADHLYLIASDPANITLPLFAGVASQQTGGPFTNASMKAKSVFSTAGSVPPNSIASDRSLGIFTMDGMGGYALTGDQNNAGTIVSNDISGTYSVEPNGRVALTGLSSSVPVVLYLTDAADGFIVGADSHVTFGAFQVQGALHILGGTVAIGTASHAAQGNFDVAGTMTFSNGSFTGVQAQSLLPSELDVKQLTSGTYTIAQNGRGTMTLPEFAPFGDNIFYMVSNNTFVMLGSGDPGVTVSLQFNGACSQRGPNGFGVCLP
jgi:hypothetical protein